MKAIVSDKWWDTLRVIDRIVWSGGKMILVIVAIAWMSAAWAGNTGSLELEFGAAVAIGMFSWWLIVFGTLAGVGYARAHGRTHGLLLMGICILLAVGPAFVAYGMVTRINSENRERRDRWWTTSVWVPYQQRLAADEGEYLLAPAYDTDNELKVLFLWFSPRPGVVTGPATVAMERTERQRVRHIGYINDTVVPLREGLNVFYAFDVLPPRAVRVDQDTAAWIKALVAEADPERLPELRSRIVSQPGAEGVEGYGQ